MESPTLPDGAPVSSAHLLVFIKGAKGLVTLQRGELGALFPPAVQLLTLPCKRAGQRHADWKLSTR